MSQDILDINNTIKAHVNIILRDAVASKTTKSDKFKKKLEKQRQIHETISLLLNSPNGIDGNELLCTMEYMNLSQAVKDINKYLPNSQYNKYQLEKRRRNKKNFYNLVFRKDSYNDQ